MLPKRRRIASRAFIVLLTLTIAQGIRAETVALHPIADTTLIQVAPDANMGGSDFFNAGTAGNGNRNRGLMQFSLLDAIPPGSTILNAFLTLDIVHQPGVDLTTGTFTLRRVLVSWGEGDKRPAEEGSPGLGAPATDGEANWVFRFVGGPAWSVPGGQNGADFSAVVSSTAYVYGLGDPVEFESTPNLTADVQSWLDDPQSNHGWMLTSEDERIRKTARGFASSEDPGGGPTLMVEFTPVPEPCVLTLLSTGLVFLLGWRRGSIGQQAAWWWHRHC